MSWENIWTWIEERSDVLAEMIQAGKLWEGVAEQLRDILEKTRGIRKELDWIISSQKQVTRAVSCINRAAKK